MTKMRNIEEMMTTGDDDDNGGSGNANIAIIAIVDVYVIGAAELSYILHIYTAITIIIESINMPICQPDKSSSYAAHHHNLLSEVDRRVWATCNMMSATGSLVVRVVVFLQHQGLIPLQA